MRLLRVLLGLSMLCLVAHAAEPGLVAHWDFNECSGAVARDLTDHGPTVPSKSSSTMALSADADGRHNSSMATQRIRIV